MMIIIVIIILLIILSAQEHDLYSLVRHIKQSHMPDKSLQLSMLLMKSLTAASKETNMRYTFL